MHEQTHDGHNAMTIAGWPLASGANDRFVQIESICRQQNEPDKH